MFEFTALPRAVWIEISGTGAVLSFRLQDDTATHTRTIPSTGWYPWRVAEIDRDNTTSQVTKVIGDS